MLLVLAFVYSAHAQSEVTQPASGSQSSADVMWAKETILDESEFRDLKVDGTLVGPGGAYTFIPPRPGFHPMIRVRANFRAEMHKSVDEVR